MDMESGHLTELSSNLLHTDGTHSYNLRVVEQQDQGGTTKLMFGIGEFWLCDNSNRAYMSRKHNVYLPISVWPKLVALGRHVEQFTSEASKCSAQSDRVTPTDSVDNNSNVKSPVDEADLLRTTAETYSNCASASKSIQIRC